MKLLEAKKVVPESQVSPSHIIWNYRSKKMNSAKIYSDLKTKGSQPLFEKYVFSILRSSIQRDF